LASRLCELDREQREIRARMRELLAEDEAEVPPRRPTSRRVNGRGGRAAILQAAANGDQALLDLLTAMPGLKQVEIGRQLRVSSSTVQNRLVRLMRRQLVTKDQSGLWSVVSAAAGSAQSASSPAS
jgi:hypothetical protein